MPQPPDDLKGLALSGGGIRSATFQLGVLQALQAVTVKDRRTSQDKTLLQNVDYMSAVSGGSYIAAWMVAHLVTDRKLHDEVDPYGFLVATDDPEKLLDPGKDFVQHLRDRSGFIKEGGWVEGPRLIWSWVWRELPYLFFDVFLHVKTVPSVANQLHLMKPYKDRIEGSYFRGRETTLLDQVNRDESFPYLIVNGNLVNRGKPQSQRRTGISRDNAHFEFTRDFTGSDSLGYVPTRAFGLPVRKVIWQNEKPVEVVVSEPVEVERLCAPVPKDEAGQPVEAKVEVRGEPCVLLSSAVASSGAAFDLESNLADAEYLPSSLHVIGRLLLAPLNMNFEYQTWNYARSFDGFWGTSWDYFSMLTWQRIRWPQTSFRWIEITDGAFVDNLGVYALLRRGVSHVIAGDATMDPHWTYHYLKKLRAVVEHELKLDWCNEVPNPGEIVWHRKFWVKRPGSDSPFAVIHYLKPYADNPNLFRKNPNLKRSTDPGPTTELGHPKHLDDGVGGVPRLHEVNFRRVMAQLQARLRKPSSKELEALMQSLEDVKPRLLEEVVMTRLEEGKLKSLKQELERPVLKGAFAELVAALRRVKGEQLANHAALSLVKRFATSDLAKEFPHTSTRFQWFEPEEFEAYRHLGYLMGKTYLSGSVFEQAPHPDASEMARAGGWNPACL